MVCGPC
jgi:hypothetical protein